MEEGGIVIVESFGEGLENFEGGKFRSGKRRWKERIRFGRGGWHCCTPRGHVLREAETRESIHQDQHGAPRASMVQLASSVLPCRSFVSLGGQRRLGCWLNRTWPTRGGRSVRDLGAEFARVAPKTRDKRGEEGEGAAVFRRITLDRVR